MEKARLGANVRQGLGWVGLGCGRTYYVEEDDGA